MCLLCLFVCFFIIIDNHRFKCRSCDYSRYCNHKCELIHRRPHESCCQILKKSLKIRKNLPERLQEQWDLDVISILIDLYEVNKVNDLIVMLNKDILNNNACDGVLQLKKYDFIKIIRYIQSTKTYDQVIALKESEEDSKKFIWDFSKDQCWSCHKREDKLLKCNGCLYVSYCSQRCQFNDWNKKKDGHKQNCKLYRNYQRGILDGRFKIMRIYRKYIYPLDGKQPNHYHGLIKLLDLRSLMINSEGIYKLPVIHPFIKCIDMAIRDLKTNYGLHLIRCKNIDSSMSRNTNLFRNIDNLKFVLDMQYKGLWFDTSYINLLAKIFMKCVHCPYDMNPNDFSLNLDWICTIIIQIISLHMPWIAKGLIQFTQSSQPQSFITKRVINGCVLMIGQCKETINAECIKVTKQDFDIMTCNGQPLDCMLEMISYARSWNDFHIQSKCNGLSLIREQLVLGCNTNIMDIMKDMELELNKQFKDQCCIININTEPFKWSFKGEDIIFKKCDENGINHRVWICGSLSIKTLVERFGLKWHSYDLSVVKSALGFVEMTLPSKIGSECLEECHYILTLAITILDQLKLTDIIRARYTLQIVSLYCQYIRTITVEEEKYSHNIEEEIKRPSLYYTENCYSPSIHNRIISLYPLLDTFLTSNKAALDKYIDIHGSPKDRYTLTVLMMHKAELSKKYHHKGSINRIKDWWLLLKRVRLQIYGSLFEIKALINLVYEFMNNNQLECANHMHFRLTDIIKDYISFKTSHKQHSITDPEVQVLDWTKPTLPDVLRTKYDALTLSLKNKLIASIVLTPPQPLIFNLNSSSTIISQENHLFNQLIKEMDHCPACSRIAWNNTFVKDINKNRVAKLLHCESCDKYVACDQMNCSGLKHIAECPHRNSFAEYHFDLNVSHSKFPSLTSLISIVSTTSLDID